MAGSEAQKDEPKLRPVSKSTHAKFSRGPGARVKGIRDKKLKRTLQHVEGLHDRAQADAKLAYEWLQTGTPGHLEAEGTEVTRHFKQTDIINAVPVGAARKAFQLHLPDLGPYSLAFTRAGRHLAFAGAKGHLALMDWVSPRLLCELQVRETTHDVCALHNELFFATAQRKYVYIYDSSGAEVHCCKENPDPLMLEFLPYHFLLASASSAGVLMYQDTSHGEIVAKFRTQLGPPTAMCQNPANAVVCLGHARGRTTLWTPNSGKPAVSMQCHLGPVRSLAVDTEGRYLVSAGLDRQVHVWDLRKSYQQVHSYFAYSPATALSVSQRGMLAVAYGSQVQVWKDALATKAKAPYLEHNLHGSALRSVKFCPYEDVLALGHAEGVSTMLVPGAGEPTFDSWVANPLQSRKERQEQEVQALLDKLPADMISLDAGQVAKVTKVPKEVAREKAEEEREANAARVRKRSAKAATKKRMKGKNRGTRLHKRKQDNIVEAKRVARGKGGL